MCEFSIGDDNGDASVVSKWEKVFLHKSNSIPDVKSLDNLIGWTLTYAGKVTLNLNLS